ncbi:MAG: hypothetical protein WCK01_03400 [Candidatus Uhrbacteria bacterium]
MLRKLQSWLKSRLAGSDVPNADAKQLLALKNEFNNALEASGNSLEEHLNSKKESTSFVYQIEYQSEAKMILMTSIHSLEIIRTRALELASSEERDALIAQLDEAIEPRRDQIVVLEQLINKVHDVVASESAIRNTLDNVSELKSILKDMPYEHTVKIYALAKRTKQNPRKLLEKFAKDSKGKINFERDIAPLLPRVIEEWKNKHLPSKPTDKGLITDRKKMN